MFQSPLERRISSGKRRYKKLLEEMVIGANMELRKLEDPEFEMSSLIRSHAASLVEQYGYLGALLYLAEDVNAEPRDEESSQDVTQ